MIINPSHILLKMTVLSKINLVRECHCFIFLQISGLIEDRRILISASAFNLYGLMVYRNSFWKTPKGMRRKKSILVPLWKQFWPCELLTGSQGCPSSGPNFERFCAWVRDTERRNLAPFLTILLGRDTEGCLHPVFTVLQVGRELREEREGDLTQSGCVFGVEAKGRLREGLPDSVVLELSRWECRHLKANGIILSDTLIGWPRVLACSFIMIMYLVVVEGRLFLPILYLWCSGASQEGARAGEIQITVHINKEWNWPANAFFLKHWEASEHSEVNIL